MKLNIIFLESEVGFTRGTKQFLQRIIKETANYAADLLKMKGIMNFVVYPVIKSSSMRGLIHTKEGINLFVLSNLKESPENNVRLRSTVYHEMHHWARGFYMFRADGKISSLIEAIFSEGLAVAFEEENIPGYKSYYSFCDLATLQKLLPVVKKEKDNTKYNVWDWFDETGAGYMVGKYFMDSIFKKKYPYLNSTMLARAKIEELLDHLYFSSGINLK